MTLPRVGFSLAVSGSTIPLFVLVSASDCFTITRSCRGRSFIVSFTSSKCAGHTGFLIAFESVRNALHHVHATHTTHAAAHASHAAHATAMIVAFVAAGGFGLLDHDAVG